MCEASAFYQQLVQVAALAVARQAPSVQVDVYVGLERAYVLEVCYRAPGTGPNHKQVSVHALLHSSGAGTSKTKLASF